MSPKFATTEHVLKDLRSVVVWAGDQKRAAKHLGISEQFLCDVLRGRRALSTKLLNALGYRKVDIYEQFRRWGER